MYRQKGSTPPLVRSDVVERSKKLASTSSQDALTGVELENDHHPDSTQSSVPSTKDKLNYINDSFICDMEDPKEVQGRNGGWSAAAKPEKYSKEEKEKGFFHHLESYLLKHKRNLKRVVKGLLFILYNIYFGFAIHTTWDQSVTWCDGVKFLTIITIISYTFAFYSYIFKPHLLRRIRPCLLPVGSLIQKVFNYKHTSKVVWAAVFSAIIVFLVIDTIDDRYRLVSAGGLLILVLVGYVFSKHRSQIVWRHLMWGLTIQFCIGLLILRWSVGKDVFNCLGEKVKILVDITDKGSTFVFGYLVSGEMVGIAAQPAVFAFKVLSVVIFFSFIVSLLYYYGVMQVLVVKLGWLLQKTIGTTACESMNAAGNIFLGLTESPLLIRPYLPLMTKSELHAVMTGGYATVAGTVLFAYINFGIDATHLLTASVMAAPAALACSKLMYPETEESQTQVENIKIEERSESNALEAAVSGASTAIFLVSNIAANIIAFVAFIALVDTFIGWLGSLVLWNDVSCERIMSKVFIPVSLLMGVDWKDREPVANLIGLKTMVNNFVAYKKLADYQQQKLISERSAAIATFALCGFCHISAIGIQMGTLFALVPKRKSDISQVAIRAMISGCITCFLNACVAGMLLKH